MGLNLVKVETSKGDEVQIAAPPINRTIDTRNGLPPPPKLGEHTTKVFKEFGVWVIKVSFKRLLNDLWQKSINTGHGY